MALSGLVPIFLSLLPLWFRRHLVPTAANASWWRIPLTSALLCFGAGVLLATSLVHMLPEVGGSVQC
jgi:hypothetical protein